MPSSSPSKEFIFARHETFHPRYGWLKKGFDKTKENSKLFLNSDEAPLTLGVGKNMAKAIEYWCWAYKILEKKQGKKVFTPSFLGDNLLGDQGWDPYLEELSSLWLFHWNLLKPPCYATAWELILNEPQPLEFTDADLLNCLVQQKQKSSSIKVNESTLRKDVDCFLRMYVKQTHKKKMSEETLDCPFAELSLIQRTEKKQYTFNLGEKPGLNPFILVAACLEFAGMNQEKATISISRLMYQPGSPGVLFKLTESVLYNAIEYISKKNTKINLLDTAGTIQFSFRKDPFELAHEILRSYYQ